MLYRYIENIEISIRYRYIVSYRIAGRNMKFSIYRDIKFRYIILPNFHSFIHSRLENAVQRELEIFLAAPNIPIYQSLDDDASTSHHDAAEPILTPLQWWASHSE